MSLDIPENADEIYNSDNCLKAREHLLQYIHAVPRAGLIDTIEMHVFHIAEPHHIKPRLSKLKQPNPGDAIEIVISAPLTVAPKNVVIDDSMWNALDCDVYVPQGFSREWIDALPSPEKIAVIQFAFASRMKTLMRKMHKALQKGGDILGIQERMNCTEDTYEEMIKSIT